MASGNVLLVNMASEGAGSEFLLIWYSYISINNVSIIIFEIFTTIPAKLN